MMSEEQRARVVRAAAELEAAMNDAGGDQFVHVEKTPIQQISDARPKRFVYRLNVSEKEWLR